MVWGWWWFDDCFSTSNIFTPRQLNWPTHSRCMQTIVSSLYDKLLKISHVLGHANLNLVIFTSFKWKRIIILSPIYSDRHHLWTTICSARLFSCFATSNSSSVRYRETWWMRIKLEKEKLLAMLDYWLVSLSYCSLLPPINLNHIARQTKAQNHWTNVF